MQWITFALLAVVLLIGAYTDVRRGIVPNWLTLPAILLGVIWAVVLGAVLRSEGELGPSIAHQLMLCGGAFLAAFIPMATIFFLGGLGGGDVKLMAAVGAISASFDVVLGTMFIGLLIAAVMALISMFRNKLGKRTLTRIVSAAMTASAKVKPDMPTDSPRIPVSLGLCIGGLLSGLEYLVGVPMPWS